MKPIQAGPGSLQRQQTAQIRPCRSFRPRVEQAPSFKQSRSSQISTYQYQGGGIVARAAWPSHTILSRSETKGLTRQTNTCTSHQPTCLPEAVESCSLLGIAEDLVCFRNELEPLLERNARQTSSTLEDLKKGLIRAIHLRTEIGRTVSAEPKARPSAEQQQPWLETGLVDSSVLQISQVGFFGPLPDGAGRSLHLIKHIQNNLYSLK